MNVMCAVSGYKLLGISDLDICIAIGCTKGQLEDILTSDVYSEITTDIMKAFVRGQENTARDVLAKSAMHAANVLVTTARNGKNEANKLRAAEGILDRMNVTGDAHHGMSGPGLVIKIVKEHKNDGITITM
jgi:methyl coenzyme M reductase beta subunit